MPVRRTADEAATPADRLATELAEAVHRTRNDLAAVVAMLRLHTAAAAPGGAARAALDEARARVEAVARVNARLDAGAPGVAVWATVDAGPSSPGWRRTCATPPAGGRCGWSAPPPGCPTASPWRRPARPGWSPTSG